MKRFAAFYSETPDIRIGDNGWSTDGRTFGSPARAVEVAEQWLAEGRYGVTVQNLEEAVYQSWPMCRTVTSDSGAYWCVRQDLLSDGRCPEHTQGGTPRPSRPHQLALLDVTPSTGGDGR
ncbi:hypothetical protein [Peterkaempfera sp. SMS 1(5)a]|uniref:hypothetical protein n=1 Tax=Peterkaempfera podocarpi TaxID=3232308 RepID=UPI00366A8146